MSKEREQEKKWMHWTNCRRAIFLLWLLGMSSFFFLRLLLFFSISISSSQHPYHDLPYNKKEEEEEIERNKKRIMAQVDLKS